MIRMTTPQMAPLFTDLALGDSSAIATHLDRKSIAYMLKDNGSIIPVPKEKVARLPMTLAENGLHKSGGGYEIFDKSDPLDVGGSNPHKRVAFIRRWLHEAQSLLVNIAQNLAVKGEILISKSRSDDELIF